MKNLTLKQLRYFEALARDGRFRRAADACAISQPALSMQIKELEQELGGELFERNAREVKLTAFGQTVALRIRDILRGVDELAELARAARDPFLTRLRIGIIPTIAPYLLPAIINDLNRSFAGIQIEVRETQTSKLVQELAQGQLDTAIVALPVSEPSLAELELFKEEFVLVRQPEDEGKPVPEREALREMRLLLLEEGHCFRDQALSFCKIGQARPREVMEGSSLSTLVQMVSAGIGITLIPEMAVPLETRSAHVSISRFQSPQPSRTIGMIWRNSTPMAKHLQQVSEAVRRSADSMREQYAAR
ncbi:LysR family transcriptional regulator (plasmid) [Rhizobium leguminosarum]|uniref:hydrogen peroxide-inducible genes activator n=1 Tax=Rhizobium leguminosarum TaxID=384 RepID=UPI00144133E0|nr:hydrogen peroxide-inducible genes activator [Rhizobium leguminosarum]MBY5835090.1 LysR family transcriptional regulator [Rhizobium leguminosarum]NKM75946.1 LysR family transcriptional regulator [Rhizobium leguminosarum bv. viciae]QSZ11492.1 LysR family transcriptional regulator [Rhizobium leguminosarum]